MAWAVFYWITAIFAAQVTRLAREHPDLYLSRKMSGKSPRRSGADRSQRILENQQRKQRRKLIVTSTVFGLLTLLGFGGLVVAGSSEDPSTDSALPSPAATFKEFKSAWNRVDLEGLAELAGEEHREKRLASLTKAMRTYEWGSELPTITGYTSRPPVGNRAEADFATVGGDLKVAFLWDGERWSCSGRR